MTQPIEMLTKEHRVIEAVLGALDTASQGIRRGEEVDRKTIGQFAEFFSNFADKCHHGKEEQILFSSLADYGFSRQAGPVAVMLYEHELGRSHVRALAAIGAGSGPLTEEEKAGVLKEAAAFIPLLVNHIAKEDRVLFPMAMNALPSEELASVGRAFDDFEQSVMGEGAHQAFHRLADELTTRYAPAPVAQH